MMFPSHRNCQRHSFTVLLSKPTDIHFIQIYICFFLLFLILLTFFPPVCIFILTSIHWGRAAPTHTKSDENKQKAPDHSSSVVVTQDDTGEAEGRVAAAAPSSHRWQIPRWLARTRCRWCCWSGPGSRRASGSHRWLCCTSSSLRGGWKEQSTTCVNVRGVVHRAGLSSAHSCPD